MGLGRFISFGVGFGIRTIPVLALNSSVGCLVHDSIDLETSLGPLLHYGQRP